ncbi:MAG: carboxypeptidase-like regulatory domain-containing protein, partial [Planctomycetota bacterium]
TSARNVTFLALTAGMGIAVFLVARGPFLRGAQARAATLPIVVTTTADQSEPQPAREGPGASLDPGLVSLDRTSVGGDEVPEAGAHADTTVIWPLEVDLLMVLDGRVETPEGAQAIRSGAHSGVRGSILGSTGRPMSGRVEFVYGPNEGRVLHTDAQGRFGARNLYQGISIVRVTTSEGFTLEREVSLASMGQTDFYVSFANTSVVAGTVKDDRGVAVEGAEVRMDGKPAFTNSEGEFVFSNVPPGNSFVTVRKEGFAHCVQRVSVRHRSSIAAKDFPIFLKKGGRLQISVDRSAGALEASYAFLMPASGPSRSSSGRSFPWHEVNPVKIPPGGNAIVENLPLEAVNVRLFHRGAIAKPKSRNVRLHADRLNSVVLELTPAPTVRGVVLDGGKPVKGATVQIEAADRSVATSKVMQQRGPRFAMEMVVATTPAAFDETKTDGQGRFSFTSHSELITTYYATVTSRDGARRGVAVIQPGTETVTISLEEVDDRDGAVEIELPGRFQGLPVDLTTDGTPG